MNYIVVGCGITGSVIARKLAENGNKVIVYERRNHIAGNMYDYKDEHGILVQKYGPHIFHTSNQDVINYIKKYENWNNFKLVCGASWNNRYTNTPFNFSTIDTFFDEKKAEIIKNHLNLAYPIKKVATVVELLEHSDSVVREFAEFLFENDYAPYTAKQWGMNPSDVDPSVLKRVPIILSYETGYFNDTFEAMPSNSFTNFVKNILNHENIEIKLNTEAKQHIVVENNTLYWDGKLIDGKIIYTGPLDELFNCCYGNLPYRSLEFKWNYYKQESFQNAPVVAYPQEEGYTRITEYKKLPPQSCAGTTVAFEYPKLYKDGETMEPYYPVATEESAKLYEKYKKLADKVANLVYCGRLADFKYYNMDQSILRALMVADELLGKKN